MRVLVDTCVIIDALQSRVPFADVAQKIFIYSANKRFDGYIPKPWRLYEGKKANKKK